MLGATALSAQESKNGYIVSGGAHGVAVNTQLGAGVNLGLSRFHRQLRLNGSVAASYIVEPGSYSNLVPGCGDQPYRTSTCLEKGIVFGLMLDGTFEVPLGASAILIGGGYRFGSKARPYGTAGIWHTPADFDTELGLQVYVGRRYVHVAVVMAKRVPRRKT